MPKDALTIYRAAEELKLLVGGKVDKVNMPDRDTLLLLVHTRTAGNHRLIMSCNPSLPRVHITTRRYENPDAATGTLMFFRKRLVGATVAAVEPDRSERMVTFRFAALDELLRPVEYMLACELTGKCANLIFVENGLITNALRRVTAEAPGKRAVLVGLPYTLPNATGRVPVTDRAALAAAVAVPGLTLRSALNRSVAGLAQTTVDELLFRLGIGEGDAAACVANGALDSFIAAAETLYTSGMTPTVTFDGDRPLDYFVQPYATCGGDAKAYPTLNAAMDAYYSALFDAAEFALHAKPLRSAVAAALKKNRKRLADATAKLDEAAGADRDRMLGELITANIYKIRRGDTSVTVDNWFDGGTVTIALDNTKTAAQNAAVHFKTYNKKKKAAVYALEAAKTARSAIDELEGIATELALCTAKPELAEVRAELVALGLMKPEQKRKKDKPVPSEPYCFDVLGAKLLVGKNHAQNDRITRAAAATDTWLHVKDAHGCHAVLKTPAPTDAQLIAAAEIAAFYSQAGASDNVAVDYTDIKHVYPKGAGHVDYKEYRTLYVKPKRGEIAAQAPQ